mmetsp:Transcript_1121/g.1790  ORF Transcript_1121/g.1790 Transcript_1121/m.1790 type:complete len:258 (-) Transcript_1121:1892-2665(-)
MDMLLSMTGFLSVDPTTVYMLLLFCFDSFLCSSVISRLQTSCHLRTLSFHTHRNLPNRAHCWRIQHTLRSKFHSMMSSRPGRYKVHKRWYWYNASIDPNIGSTSDATKHEYESTNSEHTHTEHYSSTSFFAHWYQHFKSIIVVTWITGCMTFAFATWSLRCCIFLLMRLVRCTWHCGRILHRQYRKGNLRLQLREIPTLCYLCYSFSDAMNFDSLYNPGVLGLFKIVVDSGASFCYTFDRRDFIEGTYRDIGNQYDS